MRVSAVWAPKGHDRSDVCFVCFGPDDGLGGVRIAVVGTGYVRLVVGVCLAESGAGVVCIDVDQVKLRLLEHRQVPFFEPGAHRCSRATGCSASPLATILRRAFAAARWCSSPSARRRLKTARLFEPRAQGPESSGHG
jgi:hypothetical protein